MNAKDCHQIIKDFKNESVKIQRYELAGNLRDIERTFFMSNRDDLDVYVYDNFDVYVYDNFDKIGFLKAVQNFVNKYGGEVSRLKTILRDHMIDDILG